MPGFNQTPIEPAERLELNVYQCGHSGKLQVALEKTIGDEASLSYRISGPKMRSATRLVHHEFTRQDARMIRRLLDRLDPEGSDQ